MTRIPDGDSGKLVAGAARSRSARRSPRACSTGLLVSRVGITVDRHHARDERAALRRRHPDLGRHAAQHDHRALHELRQRLGARHPDAGRRSPSCSTLRRLVRWSSARSSAAASRPSARAPRRPRRRPRRAALPARRLRRRRAALLRRPASCWPASCSTPSAFQGDSYLLPSVAAVVLGGTSLLGGRGSVGRHRGRRAVPEPARPARADDRRAAARSRTSSRPARWRSASPSTASPGRGCGDSLAGAGARAAPRPGATAMTGESPACSVATRDGAAVLRSRAARLGSAGLERRLGATGDVELRRRRRRHDVAAATASRSAGAPSWCGTKKITLALADGFGDNNWRRITTAEGARRGNEVPERDRSSSTPTARATPRRRSPTSRASPPRASTRWSSSPTRARRCCRRSASAYKAGVVTVSRTASPPAARPARTTTTSSSTDFKQAGVLWGEWLVKALGGKGATSSTSAARRPTRRARTSTTACMSVLKDHPDIKFIGQTPFTSTNWDPAQTQKVVTALLAKYPKIDAITTDFGAALASSFGAFKQAGRKIPAVATEDSNQLSLRPRRRRGQPRLHALHGRLAELDGPHGDPVRGRQGHRRRRCRPRPTVPQKPFEDSISGQPQQADVRQVAAGRRVPVEPPDQAQIEAALK